MAKRQQIHTFDKDSISRIAESVRVTEGLDDTHPSRNLRRQIPSAGPRRTRFKNTSSSQAPPYAIMAVTGSTTYRGLPVLKIAKPGTTFYRRFLVNGATAVGSGGQGFTQRPGEHYIIGYTGTPANGEGWGPKDGSWLLNLNYPETTIVDEIYNSASTPKLLVGTLHTIDSMIGETTAAISADDIGTNYIVHYGRSQNRNDAGYTTVPSAEFTVEMEDETPIKITFPNGLALAGPLKCEAFA